MKLRFLGTGTSCGVPVIGCQCEVCTSTDPHDHRLRCSALVETSSTRLLIDCGPDFRQQMLPLKFRKIDAILVTHHHYDHVGGMDDLRPFCIFGDINIYADSTAAANIRHNMPYCFVEHKYPGVPNIRLIEVSAHESFTVGDLSITPFIVMHGRLPILAYRIESLTSHSVLVYITDMKTISPSEVPYARGADVMVINALRFTKAHHSHLLVDESLAFIREVSPTQALLVHSCHDIGLHSTVNARLPHPVRLAYDGEEIEVSPSCQTI